MKTFILFVLCAILYVSARNITYDEAAEITKNFTAYYNTTSPYKEIIADIQLFSMDGDFSIDVTFSLHLPTKKIGFPEVYENLTINWWIDNHLCSGIYQPECDNGVLANRINDTCEFDNCPAGPYIPFYKTPAFIYACIAVGIFAGIFAMVGAILYYRRVANHYKYEIINSKTYIS